MKSMRSVLFVPGDSEKKLEKSRRIPADVIVYDLEDSVLPERRDRARCLVAAMLADAKRDDCVRCVRINPLDGADALLDLAAIMRASPDLIMLPKLRSASDVERLDHYLSVLEIREGLALGSTRILALVTETPEIMLAPGGFGKANGRLAAMAWGAEDLATALGASTNKDEDGSWIFTYQMARSQCLLAARDAGVLAIDSLHANFKDSEGLRLSCRKARRDGFDGKIAIHPAQVEDINAIFTPSAEEVARAQAVIATFAANPTAGTVQLEGKMLDLPHLKLAQRTMRQHDASSHACG